MDLSTIGIFIGAALMIGSPAYWIWWRIQVARHWTLVDGVMIRMGLSEGSAGTVDHMTRPIIGAHLLDGETVIFKSPYGVEPSPRTVEDVVTVRVRGDVAKHDSFGAALTGYGALFAIGVFMLVKSCGG